MEVSAVGKERLSRWKVITRAGILLGFGLLIAGFIVRDVSPPSFARAAHLTLGLWIAACVLVLAGIGLNFKALMGLFRTGRAAEGANFALVVVLSIGLAALLCYISTRRFARMDWTGKRQYSLHSKTKNILRGLDQDVKVTVLYAFTNLPMQDQETIRWREATVLMLEEFKALSRHITVAELDWTHPDMTKKANQLRQELAEDDLPGVCVIFEGVEGHQIVSKEKTVEILPQSPPTFTGEDAFATALIKLTEKEKATIYALTGHGEKALEVEQRPQMPYPMRRETVDMASDPRFSLSRLVKELAKDHYEVKTLDLMVEGSVPEDCAVLLVAGPRTPLDQKEIEAIRDYLDNRDGRAIFLADSELLPDVDTNIDDLLANYGVRLRTDAIGMFMAQDIFGRATPRLSAPVVAEGMAEHPATAGLTSFRLWFDQPCPIEVEPSPSHPMLAARPLLTSVDKSWGETDIRLDSGESQVVEYTPGRDVSQPITVGVVVEPTAPPGQPPMPTDVSALPGPRLVVLGSSLAFVNGVLAGNPSHLYLFQNCVNWMAGKLHMLGIPPKTVEFNTVSVSDSQIRLGRYLLIAILPVCIVVLGFGVWLARRR